MSKVAAIAPHLSSVRCPEDLVNLEGWLMWRYEQHEGEPKPRKVPYYTNKRKRSGVNGCKDDRANLTTFEAARSAAAKGGFDGIGLALMPEFNIVALDFDDCVGGSGVDPKVEQLVAGTYAEYSPSGRGVRAFFKGNVGNHKAFGGEFGFETFSTKGFVTFTGNTLGIVDLLGLDDTVAKVSSGVVRYCEQRFGSADEDDEDGGDLEPLGWSPEQITEALDYLPDDLPYEADRGGMSWLAVGMAVYHETRGSDWGFELWDKWSARSPKYSTSRYGWQKWESFGRREGGRKITARSLRLWANAMGARILPGDVASPDEFEDLGADDSDGDSRGRFKVQPAAEFSQGKPPGWIIKGLMPRADLVLLFGEAGSGKSFVALDLMMCVARGVDWRGMRVKQGRIVYIAAEGAGGFRLRLQAYAKGHDVDLDDLPFGVIHAAPNFLEVRDAKDVAKAIVEAGGADIIVVDTTAQVTPGANENSSEDMGKALKHCRGLNKATGATVILIHHAGKDTSKGARGWSGLKGAADAEIEIIRARNGRIIHNSKQKDGQDGEMWGFDLEVVNIGMDEDGDIIDSCIVTEAAVPTQQRAKKTGPWEIEVEKVVAEMAQGGLAGIEVDAICQEVARRMPAPEEGKRDTRRQRAKRALERLANDPDSDLLLEDDGTVTVL